MNIIEKKRRRYEYLKKMFEEADGSQNAIFDMHELGEGIGFSYIEVTEIVDYLMQEDLIAAYGIGGTIHITHSGIKEMEQALTEPDKSTEHFPAFNIIQIGTMNNSSLQQATHQSAIHQHLEKHDIPGLDKLIKAFERIQKSLELSADLQEEFISEVQTLKIQQKSPRPKTVVVRECLQSIRSILEGIVGNTLTPSVILAIGKFLQS